MNQDPGPPDAKRTQGGPDAASLAVLIARLSGIAEEMGAVLQRSAFSPNIKERADCSAAVFGPDGSILAQAEHIPVHLGSMPASVKAVIDELGSRMGPGDQAIVNDPFAGGTHLNDVTIVAPCFTAQRSLAHPGGASGAGTPGDDTRGGLVGWVANRAHHADVGGAAPGSIPADATEVFQEGLRLPPMLLTDEVREVLLANSRTPLERSGDLAAQIGANEVGLRRLRDLEGEPFDAVLDHGRRRARSVLAALPAGQWSASEALDSTGPRPDQQHPARLHLSVRITRGADVTAAGENDDAPAITFDFTGTDPQRYGNTNAVRAVTVSAVGFAVRAALDPTLPANAGVMEPVHVVTTPGSLVDARSPAAVGAGNVEVSQRVADLCQAVLAQVVPERVPAAGQGTMNNLLMGGVAGSDVGSSWVYYETVGGGQGGRPAEPGRSGGAPIRGMSGVHTGMTNTKNTPIEALERAYPLRVLRYRLRRGSGGAGWAPGGEGIERDLQVLEDATVSLITERRVSASRGDSLVASPGRWGRTGCCPAATRPEPSAYPTSARSS